MSDENKIEAEDLAKALSTLQDLAKGHSSKGTNTTEVFSQTGEGGSSQVHHTGADSDPNGWAGSNFRTVGENGASDAIDENGTDYNGGAEMVKSILSKLAKGIALTADEFAVIKGLPAFLDKDKDDKKDDDKDDAKKAMDDDDDDKDVKKSLADEAAANETVSGGMEISEFLAELVGTLNKSLTNMEARLVSHVDSVVAASDTRQESFGKSLAGALGTLGEGLAATAQRVDQVEGQPARAPKSQQVASQPDMAKSLQGGGDKLEKSVVAATMVDMVQQKKIDAQEVIRFDTDGRISDETLAKVHAHRAGN